MKALLFGDHTSPHVYKWSGYLEEAGVQVTTVGYGSRSFDAYPYGDLRARRLGARTLRGKLHNLLADIGLLLDGRYRFANFHFLDRRHALLALLSPRPVVITCWGSDVLVDLVASRGLRRILLLAALRKARAITCDAESVRESLAASCPSCREKTVLIFWGVDTERFMPGPPTGWLRRELGIPPEATILLSNRMSSPHYQIAEIIESFSRAPAGDGSWLVVRLHPDSDPSYVAQCRLAAAKHPSIRFLDRPLSDAELPELYREVSAVLHFPKTDATPVSMLEALASGCVVIASDKVPSYRSLTDQYSIRVCPLDRLREEATRAVIDREETESRSNRATLESRHSRAATIASLRSLLESRVARVGPKRG